MMSQSPDRTIGIYLPTRIVVGDPAYLDALSQDAGVNLVILSGGFSLSPHVAALNPLGTDGKGPGISWDSDGEPLARAIDLAHERNMRVWLLLGCWQIGAEKHPELCAMDIGGHRLTDYPPFPHCSEQRSLTFCPSDESVNAFYEAAYGDVARQYPIDGVDITHARYTSPAFWPAIFACACPRCGKLATELGFDWERLRVGAREAVAALQAIDARTIRRLTKSDAGLGDFFQAMSQHPGVLQWLDFRATVISRNVQRFHAAVHRAAGSRPIVFGVDNFPPSVALLAGHRYADLVSVCDFTSALLSHPAYFVLATIQSWTTTLRQWVPDLDEATALEAVYRVLGFQHLPLPRSISQLGNGFPESEPEVPGLEELVHADLAKARLYNNGQCPSYPVLMGGLWRPETVRRLTDATFEMGHEGVIYQRSDALTSYQPRS